MLICLTSVNVNSYEVAVKTYVSIINMKNLVKSELNWTHIFRNSRRLSKLDFSTSFLIMSRETGSFLMSTRVPIILLAALLTAWIIGLSVGEVKPTKWCAYYIPHMAESTKYKWYPINAVSIELHALNLLEMHRSPSWNWKTPST